jgi:hypothetical protein
MQGLVDRIEVRGQCTGKDAPVEPRDVSRNRQSAQSLAPAKQRIHRDARRGVRGIVDLVRKADVATA